MKRWQTALAMMVFWGPSSLAAAEPFTPAEEDRIRALAIEALLERPEILRELVARLEEQERAAQVDQAQSAITALKDELVSDPNAPIGGNPDGDVTVVEFMDYNCGYCKRAAPEVAKLLEQDGDVRLVYREWPILGDGSVAAARLALAAREQDAYEAMHDALMARPRVTEQTALAVAQELGLDVVKLKADADAPKVAAHIDKSMALAQAIGVTGTPAFVIGDQFIGGLAPVEALLEAVATTRETRNE